MTSFIQQYYAAVDANLADASSSRRYPLSARLKHLHTIDRALFNRLLAVAGEESILGRATATITVEDGVSHYLLPAGFRRWISLAWQDANGRSRYLYSTQPLYPRGYGPQIISAEEGMVFDPPPAVDDDLSLVLTYQRAPGLLHYAQASEVRASDIVTGDPPSDGGEVVSVADYYNGMSVRVYAADRGVPQQRVVTSSTVREDNRVTLNLRHAFNPLPLGEVWYELCPTAPLEYDDYYAIDAAMKELIKRGITDRAQGLGGSREDLYASIKEHYASNTADRTPQRSRPLTPDDFRSYGEIP